jgi:phage FluMu protein Com
MGGKQYAGIKCPRGVTIREFKTETRLQIAFTTYGKFISEDYRKPQMATNIKMVG